MRCNLSTASISLLVAISVATSVAGCATGSAFSEDEPNAIPPLAHVFVPPLPECPPNRDAIPVRDAGKALLGKSVAFRGFLTLSAGRSCQCDHCPADEWRVLGPEARVHDPYRGRPPTALLISLPVLLPRDDLDSPDLEVVATGVLREAEVASEPSLVVSYYNQFFLEDAELCRVKEGSPNHARPFELPPSGDGHCVYDHE